MVCITSLSTWWRHQMETLSALLAFCAGNSPVFGEFPTQRPVTQSFTWWRHQMETLSVLLAFCAGNSLMTGEFPTQRHVTQSFGVFFDLRLNNRLGKQSCYWWLETPSCPLWRHLNDIYRLVQRVSTVPIFFHCTPHRFPHGFYNLRKSENFSHVIVLSRIHLCYKAMVYNSIAQHSCAYIYIYMCVCVCVLIKRIIQYPSLSSFLTTLGHMMTSSNGNIFRVTGHLCGALTGPRRIPHKKASDAELWCFLWSASE